jgi:nucleoside phosphorylase/CheY-like chemotaxis protein
MTRKAHVLVVDDDPQKAAAISALLQREQVQVGEVSTAETVHAACLHLRKFRVDLLVLDMQLPLRAQAEARPDGGLRLIDALKTDATLLVPDHIIGLTQYDELVARYREDLAHDLWFLVKYSRDSDEWERQILNRVQHITSSIAAHSDSRYRSSLAIITALHRVELEAVLQVWPELGESRIDSDAALYHTGTIQASNRQHTIVASAAPQMGMAAATALSMKVIDNYRPRYLCMTGIAAGTKGCYGDILVASQSWDYGSGKMRKLGAQKSVFEPAPERIPISNDLSYEVQWYQVRSSEARQRIADEWRKLNPHESVAVPSVHFGPLASGAAVVADGSVITGLLAHDRKLIGVEMESYGVALAASHCKGPRPDVLIAKSLCDYGDSRKGDDFQRFAAYSSAAFVRYFFEDRIFERMQRMAP